MLALQGWEVKKNFRNMTGWGGGVSVSHTGCCLMGTQTQWGCVLKTGPLGTE